MLGNKKGMAMLIVIALIMMLLILGGAVLMISTGHFGTSYHQLSRARAFYAAEAAMQYALWRCRITPANGGYDLSATPITDTFPDAINRIPIGGISIEIAATNPIGTDPEGVHPVNITVTY